MYLLIAVNFTVFLKLKYIIMLSVCLKTTALKKKENIAESSKYPFYLAFTFIFNANKAQNTFIKYDFI